MSSEGQMGISHTFYFSGLKMADRKLPIACAVIPSGLANWRDPASLVSLREFSTPKTSSSGTQPQGFYSSLHLGQRGRPHHHESATLGISHMLHHLFVSNFKSSSW